MAPAQIRLRRICGVQRAHKCVLGHGAKAGLRVVLYSGNGQTWTGTGPDLEAEICGGLGNFLAESAGHFWRVLG